MNPKNFNETVDALWGATYRLLGDRTDKLGRHRLPNREVLIQVVKRLRQAFFPAHFGNADLSPETGRFYVGSQLDGALQCLEDQIYRALTYTAACEAERESCEARALEATQRFLGRVSALQQMLMLDIQAAYDGDPAARSLDEVLACYPGINALIHHRIAHELHLLEIPFIPRLISEYAHSRTGIDIHPGARIGASHFIDHGTGVVIGETAIIGERVRIYQGVTLGAKSFPREPDGRLVKGIERHPIVEDDVVIYAGATILGRITIGHGSSIGGNVWLTRSVPPFSRIAQAHSRVETFRDGAGI